MLGGLRRQVSALRGLANERFLALKKGPYDDLSCLHHLEAKGRKRKLA